MVSGRAESSACGVACGVEERLMKRACAEFKHNEIKAAQFC